MQLWIVGEYVTHIETKSLPVTAWDFVGIYDTQEKALANCITRNRFYVPVNLNQNAPSGYNLWDGLVYPLAK